MAYTTIDKPDDYFNIVLYTGNGSTQSITGVGFQPDWIAIKRRNAASGTQNMDSVRGAANKLAWNEASAEASPGNILTSFDSDGFSVGDSAAVNGSSDTFVSWNWLANGTGVSNTAGSITSTVSANTTSGFSIVSYTGTGANATVGHGLGVAPSMIMIKARSATESWTVYNKNLTSAAYNLTLNDTSAQANNPTHFNSTAPTNLVFSVGTSGRVNVSSQTQIAYCFVDVKGYSKFGSYTGNGNADGTFIYTGFKPAWLMIKRSNAGTDRWVILDSKRDTFNVSNKAVYADDSQAENPSTSEQGLDILSNGFKIRNSNTKTNTSGATYIYMAFAENPFVTSTSIPTTAR
jgi:hypothetical protein